MADRIRQLSQTDQIKLSYFGLAKVKTVNTAAGQIVHVYNQDLGYYGNQNESRVIAELLVPAVNGINAAFMAVAKFWFESNPNAWGDFSYPYSLLARTGEEVSQDFARRSLDRIGFLGEIYCDTYYMQGLTAWNGVVGGFGHLMPAALIEQVDQAFVDLNTAYQSAKQHCQRIAAGL